MAFETTYMQRFGDALALLCNGHRPPPEMLVAWLDVNRDDHSLQNFAAVHGPSWAQGIAVIDAARVLADQPTEGLNHEMEHTPSQEDRYRAFVGIPKR